MGDDVCGLHIEPVPTEFLDEGRERLLPTPTCRPSTSLKQKRNRVRRPLFLVLVAFVFGSGFASSQTVKVDVSMANQTFEGWGTSLAWFANSVGGWSHTTNQNDLMQALFSSSNGLGLNYLRYNIGGGDDPSCGTGGAHYACITPSYHATPGYEPSSGTYNWAADANERWVATNAQSLGANLFEAVSYSPPIG